MNQYLKTRRQKRREKIALILLGLLILAAAAIVGTNDYNDLKEAQKIITETRK
jgi:hypothetical protein